MHFETPRHLSKWATDVALEVLVTKVEWVMIEINKKPTVL